MTKVHLLQTAFAAGQLDATAGVRVESPLYRNGAAELLNCRPLVSGGVASRWGTRDLGWHVAQPSVMTSFRFGDGQEYVAVFIDREVQFRWASDGASAGGLINCPWTAGMVEHLRFEQQGDLMWVVEGNGRMRCQLIRRVGATTWTREELEFPGARQTPTFRYARPHISLRWAGGDVVGEYRLEATRAFWQDKYLGQQITLTDATENDRRATVRQILSPTLARVTWDSEPMAAGRTVGNWSVGGDSGTRAPHAGTQMRAVVSASTAPGLMIASEAAFQSGHAGTAIRFYDAKASAYCSCRVTEVRSETEAVVAWDGAAPSTSEASALWEEQAFSAVRGHPRSVALHGQRLFFGGSETVGDALWGSAIGGFFDFNPGTAQAAEGIAVRIASGGAAYIRHLLSGPQLTVFTDAGVFFVPERDGEGLTPTGFPIRRISGHAATGARPGAFDGGVLYPSGIGRAVRDLTYSSEADNLVAEPVSLAATELLGDVRDAAYFAGSRTRPEQLALFVNAAGRLAVLHGMRSQKVAAWFPWETDGAFRNVCVAGGNIFVVVDRGASGVRLEAFDAASPFDGARRSEGLPFEVPHLRGRLCHVARGDDYLGAAVATDVYGTVRPERIEGELGDEGQGPAYTGLAFEWRIVPFVPALELPNGTALNDPQRVLETSLRLHGARSAKVSGQGLNLLRPGYVLGSVPASYDGWWTTKHLGFSRRDDPAALIHPITREVPMPVGVLAIKRKVIFH